MAPRPVAGCPVCRPDLAPIGPRRGENHFAVRFPGDLRLLVSLDGRMVVDCYEVIVDGDVGSAWRFVKPIQRCRCESGKPAAFIDVGRYSVSTHRAA